MAPSKAAQAPGATFTKDERVLCFHHDMLYEAKVLDTRPTEDDASWQYKIHYKGWKNTWDDWVPEDRVRKFSDENKELAAQLHAQVKMLQQKAPKSAAKGKAGRANGSEFGSSRGSEERHASVAAPGGRGPRRNRDYDLEQSQSSSLSTFKQGVKKSVKRKYKDFHVDAPKARNLATATRPDSTGCRTTRKSARAESTDWSNPSSDHWDTLKVLYSDECLAYDPLLKLPPKNYEYIDASGKLKRNYRDTPPTRLKRYECHPKLAAHIKKGTATNALHNYYRDMHHDVVLPIAGICRETESLLSSEVQKTLLYGGSSRSSIAEKPLPEEIFDTTGQTRLCRALSEIDPLTCINQNQEEGFHSRPSIKLVIPDQIKAILVDDWENVTKNQQLVPVPSQHPVSAILNDYLEYEMPRRQAGSAQADILEEVAAGLKEYFEKCLGRILLYRFERQQYLEVRELWASDKGDLSGKSAIDTYGAEHLCRLLVSLPELIAQTNMDQQSVNRLREELSKLTNWISKHTARYFVKEYETPSQDYVEKARGV